MPVNIRWANASSSNSQFAETANMNCDVCLDVILLIACFNIIERNFTNTSYILRRMIFRKHSKRRKLCCKFHNINISYGVVGASIIASPSIISEKEFSSLAFRALIPCRKM